MVIKVGKAPDTLSILLSTRDDGYAAHLMTTFKGSRFLKEAPFLFSVSL